jgi:hypothetical protein
MSVEQPSGVDAIGINTDSGMLHLTLSDHLPWDTGHLLALQEKLNSYLAFLESGEIYSVYPQAKGREFAIDVVSRYRPDETALNFCRGRNPKSKTPVSVSGGNHWLVAMLTMPPNLRSTGRAGTCL